MQNAVSSASAPSSPTPIFALAPINALSAVDEATGGMKAKLTNLGSSLIDTAHSQFPVVASSPSSLSSEDPIGDQVPTTVTALTQNKKRKGNVAFFVGF